MAYLRLWWPSILFLSLQVQGDSDVSTLKGKLFVFSYFPSITEPIYDYRITVSIASFSGKFVTARIQCKTYCGENVTDGTVLEKLRVNFGNMKTYNIPLSRERSPALFEPFNQTVYSISAVKPVVVLLGEIIDERSADCAFVHPFSAVDTEYITIATSTIDTFLQVITFNTKASIKIKAVDQYDVFDRYSSPTRYKPTDHSNCSRPKGGCNNQSYPVSEWPSVTSVEHITFDEILTYNLDSFQALSLTRFKRSICCDISGYEITSDNPVVVIAGAMESKSGLAENADNTFEFIPAIKHLGKQFIISNNTQAEKKVNIKVLTAVSSNTISVEKSGEAVETVSLLSMGDWFSFLNENKDIAILATNATLVGYLVYEFNGTGPCFTIILPILLWTNTYLWADIYLGDELPITYYVTIATQEAQKGGIVLDKKTIVQFRIFTLKLFKEDKWASITNTTEKGTHLAYRENSHEPFSIRLFAYRNKFGYCTTPGITFRTLNSKCFTTETVPGDEVDNDCDGRFDEELEDGVDNDNDTKIDEDLRAKPRVNGLWSSWVSNSECLVDCGETEGKIYEAIRHCDSPKPENDGLPCFGSPRSKNGSICTKELVLCSDQCEPFTYGYNCSKKCDKCELPCDAETGSCRKCKPGLAPPFCDKTCSDKNCHICSRDGSCFKCHRGFIVNSPGCKSCPDGTFGEDCLDKCMTINCHSCHGDTGECLQCNSGLKPPSCVDKCKTKGCLICLKNDTCISCKPGFTYSSSCSVCSRGLYGEDCTKICFPSPKCEECERESGECTDCTEGYLPPYCNTTLADPPNITKSIFIARGMIAAFVALVLSAVVLTIVFSVATKKSLEANQLNNVKKQSEE